MHVLRILLLVMTAGVLVFFLYKAITRQIPRDAFWTVIAIACAFSLNLIYLGFAKLGEPPVAIENKPPVALEEKAPVVDKANNAGPQPDEVSGKRGLTPNCEKELTRTADLLRFFANRMQMGEETQSIVADMRQQEKKISAVCEQLLSRPTIVSERMPGEIASKAIELLGIGQKKVQVPAATVIALLIQDDPAKPD